MIGIHIEEHEFFNMWQVDDLEFREYLLYNFICGYFVLDPKAYGRDVKNFALSSTIAN
jgi:hypothetical protein